MLEDSRVKAFMAVARYGNISRAALSLSITQSTVSYHIVGLEKDLGVKLFDRSSQGVSLTAAGEVFMQYALRMKSLEAEVGEVFRPEGLPTLTAPYVIYADGLCGETLLPSVLSSVHASRPSVRLVVRDLGAPSQEEDPVPAAEGLYLYCRRSSSELPFGRRGTVVGGFGMGAFCSEATLASLGKNPGNTLPSLPAAVRFCVWEPFAPLLGADIPHRTVLGSRSLGPLVRFTLAAHDTVALLPTLVAPGGDSAALRPLPLSLPYAPYEVVTDCDEATSGKELTRLLSDLLAGASTKY